MHSARIPDLAVQAIRWPIVSLDFEASALGDGSYPIEVGLAIWHGPDTPIRRWSALIAPALSWIVEGVWKDESAAIHNIPRSSLHEGLQPSAVVALLNSHIGIGGVALCDGGSHDAYWLQRLVEASNVAVGFSLASWDLVLMQLTDLQLRRQYDFCDNCEIPHRAGPDAVLNMRAFAEALGFSRIEEIEQPSPSI